jgi:hypothetical protein
MMALDAIINGADPSAPRLIRVSRIGVVADLGV